MCAFRNLYFENQAREKGVQLPDVFSKKKRSEIMARIRSRDTKLDAKMETLLKEKDFDYEKYPKMFGNPDFLVRPNILVFCDSGFWHGRNWNKLKAQLEKGSNPDYWIKHISKNKNRDKHVTRKLRGEGYIVLRFWDDEVFKDKDKVTHKIIKSGGQTHGEVG